MNDDFTDMLAALLKSGVHFVVVGAHAVAVNAVSRSTLDLDLFVRPEGENSRRIVAALRDFGAPLGAHGVTEEDFARPGLVYQIGLPPRRIDLLTRISGVTFDEAWKGRVEADVGALRVPFLGLRELVRNKRASGRPKDLLDLETMKEIGIDVDSIE